MSITYDQHGQILTYNSGELHAEIRVQNQTGAFCTKKVAIPPFKFECIRDSEGREVHYRDSLGFSSSTARDTHGNITRYADSRGYEYTQTFNAEGFLTHYENNVGVSVSYEYSPERTLQRVAHADGHGYEIAKTPDGEKSCTKF